MKLAVAIIMAWAFLVPVTNSSSKSYAWPVTPKGALYLHDDSDWWSSGREEGEEPTPQRVSRAQQLATRPAQDHDVARFSILGVSLAAHNGIDWLVSIQERLGKAQIVERGDGAAGREQLCYQSADNGGEVKLIFEHNEVFYSFFLFSDGQEWNGSDYCLKSPKIARNVATRGGLRLGLTEAETKSILGSPTYVEETKRWYEFKTHRRVRSAIRVESEDWEILGTVMLVFSNHRLVYLAVSRSEIN